MAELFIIPGLSSSTKTPGFYGETKYAAGPISTGSLPWNLLLVGNKTSAGSMDEDGTPVQVFGASEIDQYAGAGSELAIMAYGCDGKGGALAIPGVNVWLGCVAENDGGSQVAASASITLAGTASSSGTYYYRVCGVKIPFTVADNETPADAATALALAINAVQTLPVTAAAGGTGGAVVTVTARNVGPRGNWFTLFQDDTNGPDTMTSTLDGGTSMNGGGVRFTGGVGDDTPANLIAAISSLQFDVIAVACGDLTTDETNHGLWKNAINAAAAPTIGILEHAVAATTDSLTNAATITRTYLNDARWNLLHYLYSETPASQIAATAAAAICSIQKSDPGAGTQYAGMVLPGVAPQSQSPDRSTSKAEVETALGEGVTEVITAPDGTARITRLITTRCLNGATPDYRTFDACEAFVPDYCRTSARLLWETDFQPNNQRVAPSTPPELRQPPAGVATPAAWSDALTKLAREFERGEGLSGPPILIDVDNNLPTAGWDADGHFIVSAWPTKVAYPNLIVGCSVRQV